MKGIRVRLIYGVWLFATCLSGQRMAGTYPDLQTFLDICPQNDPYYAVIRRDFQILRDQVPVGDVACTEPYSKIPVAQVTEELAALQTLRFAYYMDMGRTGYLPWTPLRLYDWFKSRIAGVNIDTSLNPGSVAAACCLTIKGRLYMIQSRIRDDLNRQYRQTPDGLAAQVALFAHEVRHSEGNGYGHVSCCGIPNGCDQTYDESNLSSYAIQYYLAKQWMTGAINLGYSCDPASRTQLGNAFAQLANVYPTRFCDQKPLMLTAPASPGGACLAACTLAVSGPVTSGSGSAGGLFTLSISASTPSCGWTADSTDNWIAAAPSVNTAGDGTVSYSVAANQGASPRAGTLLAGGLQQPITQDGCAASCAPAITIDAIVSGAPGPPAIAGGSWVTIYGSNLAQSSRAWGSADFSGNNLPFALDGVSVKIDGLDAAVSYVSPAQLNVQCPMDSATGGVTVEVSNAQGTAAGTAMLQTYAPAFFLFGDKFVAAVHTDGSYVGPPDLLGGTAGARPAKPGEVVMLFGTGFGPTNPAAGAAIAFSGSALLANPSTLQIRIGGTLATVQYAGLTATGLYQFNVVIPAVPAGDQEVLAAIGGMSTPAGRFISVASQ